jgi:hypothetical protein
LLEKISFADAVKTIITNEYSIPKCSIPSLLFKKEANFDIN